MDKNRLDGLVGSKCAIVIDGLLSVQGNLQHKDSKYFIDVTNGGAPFDTQFAMVTFLHSQVKNIIENTITLQV